jgi:hypothetical protein
MRNAEIRDEHTASAQQCAALDNGQVAEAAAIAGHSTTQTIEAYEDPRGEGDAGTPASAGRGQAMKAAALLHYERYCSQGDADAGLCTTVSTDANADQRASSLFGSDNLTDNAGVSMATDYGNNLIQPVPPAALTGDQLKTPEGQDAAARRRSYNARMSLAHSVVDYTIGLEAANVQLTPDEKQQLQSEGLPVPASGSWMQVMALEASRRAASTAWAADLQRMPPASVIREIANELAWGNYYAFQNFRVSVMRANLEAAQLAHDVDDHFHGQVEMPIPSPN